MAIYSGFYDDKEYFAKSLNMMIAGLISNGVLGTKASNLQVVANTGMTIAVKAGYCWIDGAHMLNDKDYTLTIATADGVLKRIDRVVARQDLALGKTSIQILNGTLSDNPVAPNIVNDGTYHDLSLATIYIAAGTTAITQAIITDTRFNNTVCGIVTGLFENIETTGLFAQYDAEWQAFKGQMTTGDIASSLQLQINTHTTSIATNAADIDKIENGTTKTNAQKIQDKTVALTNIANKDKLIYDSATGTFKNTSSLDLLYSGSIDTQAGDAVLALSKNYTQYNMLLFVLPSYSYVYSGDNVYFFGNTITPTSVSDFYIFFTAGTSTNRQVLTVTLQNSNQIKIQKAGSGWYNFSMRIYGVM